MRKLIALCFALVLVLPMVGCTEKNMTFDIGDATQIQIKSGLTGDEVIIEDNEFVKSVTENINSLIFEKMGKVDGAGYSYMLTWMDETYNKVASITIIEENGYQISHDGYYYKVGADLSINMEPICEMLDIALSSSPAPDPINITATDIVLKEPPVLTVVCNETSVETLKGTYSWNYQNVDGTFAGIESDSVHPLGAKEYMTPLFLSPNILDYIDPLAASLQFEVAPDKVSVRYWGEECWEDFGGVESKELDVLVAEPEPMQGYSGSLSPSYSLRLEDGNYIYEVIAEWNSSKVYNGTARYSFYTVRNNPVIVETSTIGN